MHVLNSLALIGLVVSLTVTFAAGFVAGRKTR